MTNRPAKMWPKGTVVVCIGLDRERDARVFYGYGAGDLAVVEEFGCIRSLRNGNIYTGFLGTWEKFDEGVTDEDLLG